jgi:ABC-type sugar transport system substrate-binding protein
MEARSKWRQFVGLGVVICIAGSVLAVGSASAIAAQAQVVEIGYSNPAGSEPGLRAIGYGMREAVKKLKLGWKVKETDAGFSANKQVSDIDSLITQDVEGVTSWTLNAGASEGVYKRARDAGIPVIGYNSPSKFFNTTIANETDSTCDVSKEQAAYIAKRIPRARVIAVKGPAFVPSIDFTNKCFFAAAKKAGLTIVDSRSNTGSGDQTLEAQNLTQDMLAKNPEYDAAWAYADTSAYGVSAAINATGRKIWSGYGPRNDGVILIARDGNNLAIEAIKNGRMTATWDPHYEQSGAAAIQVLKPHIEDGRPLSSLPKVVKIPASVWDIKNVRRYKDQLHRNVVLPLKTS